MVYEIQAASLGHHAGCCTAVILISLQRGNIKTSNVS